MIYTFPRTKEFFEPAELVLATGVSKERFGEAILKELVDNALDEAEKANKAPVIEIAAGPFLSVRDNGPGADIQDLLNKILDFSVRASSKLAWKRPTRGYLGNALKTIFGMAHVLAPERPVVLESGGQRATVTVRPLSTGEIRVNPVLETVPIKPGFSVTVPVLVSLNCSTFAAAVLFNPHATFELSGRCVQRVGDVEKYPAEAPVSPHWFDAESLFNLAVMVAGQEDLTVREFISRYFVGLSGAKAGQAAKSCPVKRIRDLVFLEEGQGRKAALDACTGLLRTMKILSRPVPPGKLGGVGRENMAKRARQLFGVEAEGRYVRKEGYTWDDRPYVLEVYYAPAERKHIVTGLNFTGTYNPLFDSSFLGKSDSWGLHGYLKELLKSRYESGFFLAVHVIMPGVEYTSRDKKPYLPVDVVQAAGEAVARAVNSVRRAVQAGSCGGPEETTLKKAVFAVLPEAVEKASGGGRYPYSARSLYYQVRALIQQYTSRELDYNYFTPGLLTEYQEIYGPLEGLYYDPRGIAVEPHTGQEIPLGTREVADYTAPDYLYNKVLYVEKKGILPVLKAAGLDKKYDLCIRAGEGYASRAAKDFLAMAEKQDIVVLCLHDLDINGLEIARTLREETRTSRNAVTVIDLGLRYKDAVEMGLEKDPEGVPLKKGWHKPVLETLPHDELEFLTGDGKRGNRVELNALTPEQLIGLIERKLAEHGLAKKVVPPEEVVLGEARKRFDAVLRAMAERRILEILEIPAVVEKIARSVKVPDFGGLPGDIARALEDNPPVSWRDMVEEEARDFARAVLEGVDLSRFLKIGHRQ
jgi:DNA topoisomerase VI subunit B